MDRDIVLAIVGFMVIGFLFAWLAFGDGLATIDCAVGVEIRCR